MIVVLLNVLLFYKLLLMRQTVSPGEHLSLWIFFSISQRYNWHIALCKFKVFKALLWNTYILRNDYHHRFANTSIMLHNYYFFILRRTLNIYSLYVIVILTLITMPYIQSPELIHHKTGSFHPLTNTIVLWTIAAIKVFIFRVSVLSHKLHLFPKVILCAL